MACVSCRSDNVRAFTTRINIYLPGKASVLAFPKLLICFDCGLADVLLSGDELRKLKETYSSMSREVLADTIESLPPETRSDVNE